MGKLPMYQRIKRDLLDQIARGQYDPDAPLTTQRELCERYGVSMLTASRALSELQRDGVLVSSRGRGTFVAARRPSAGRSAAPGRPPEITCIIPALSSGDVMDVVHGVERTAAALGFTTSIAATDGSWERQREALRRAQHSAAVILYPVDGPGDAEAVRDLRDLGIPVVFVDRYWEELPSAAVLIDNQQIGYHLTSRLVERGFGRIATLWVETSCTSVRDRQAGHLRALRDHGIEIDAELLAIRDHFSQPDDVRRRMLASAVADGTPTAFVCSNGFVLEQALSDSLAIGLRVPDDVDFAGTDRKVGDHSTIPPLTAVTAILPHRAIGETAAGVACEAVATGRPPRPVHTVLEADFQEREESPLRLNVVRSEPA
ncbi:GntR family transcriptional regulator [Jiangella endophytica]|uniref:GntR family transcriptional regulator n=1 Tax=Jiangella endophytica TaxID=1623398 RepID=UPI0018E5289B|nr:LacI family DNA-binding transcriptional regulator [Jiangella endophytica]